MSLGIGLHGVWSYQRYVCEARINDIVEPVHIRLQNPVVKRGEKFNLIISQRTKKPVDLLFGEVRITREQLVEEPGSFFLSLSLSLSLSRARGRLEDNINTFNIFRNYSLYIYIYI